MRYPPEFMEELKSRNNIEDVIAMYCDIVGRGSRNPKCLCPFHSEKTPSFTIFPDTRSYYCFGCQSGGDVVVFIKNIERLSYPDAVKLLASRAGLPMPEEKNNDEAYRIRRRCYAANREAAKFFYKVLSLPEGKDGAEYFRSRQLKPETVTHFGLGYAPDTWDMLTRHLKKLGYSDDELVAFDLCQRTKTGGVIDRFRKRVMFPVLDLSGNVIAFTGRVLDNETKPKYMNTRGTVVYKKGDDIFGLNFAKNDNKGILILVEGNMDVIAMHQAGFTNTVATMGTAFTREQISLLGRYCKELYLCFDSDKAGAEATAKAIKQLETSTLKIKVVRMQGGKDADEILKTHGAEYMQKLLTGSVNDTEFALSQIREKYGTDTDDGKKNFATEALKMLAQITGSVERDIYLSRICEETGINQDAARAELEKNVANRQRMKKRDDEDKKFQAALGNLMGNGSLSPNPQVKDYPAAVRAEEILLATLLKSPDYLAKLGSSLSENTFVTDLSKRVFTDVASSIRAGYPVELGSFAENEGADDELKYLSYLFALSNNVGNSLSECDECIKKLLFEKNRTNSFDAGSLSDEDFMEAFRRAVERKSQGGN